VRTHVFLEVEVSEFIGFVEAQKFAEFGVSADDATVVLVLEVVSYDVLIDFFGYFSACHFSAFGATKERGKFIGDESGFYETTGFAVGYATFAASFLGGTDFAFTACTESADLSSECGDLTAESRQLSEQFSEAVANSRFGRFYYVFDGSSFLNSGCCFDSGGSISGGSFSGSGFYFTWHLIILYIDDTFLSCFKVLNIYCFKNDTITVLIFRTYA